ncbi:hypothetical protein CHU_3730 [Cytophaga hutchinsonii ATCC 33406]|uniref:DUF4783 domain-containing protein n=2 Tax=Cytophaga hutchinsonii TaxID=985 RepID=A0A6N4SWV9_CYTH3|nr:hypothetical protein CHU_3730 [Cytophaga hutchinsonii ATCC 33406]
MFCICWHYFGLLKIYMKRISISNILLVTAFMMGLAQAAEAQNAQAIPDVIENIRVSIKMANSKELTTFMGDMVEIQLPDQDRNNYSKTQAEFVLRDFMKKYPPTNFTYIHKVLDKEDFKFTIGEYVYAGGSMRITMVIKPSNSKYQIDSIVIERK